MLEGVHCRSKVGFNEIGKIALKVRNRDDLGFGCFVYRLRESAIDALFLTGRQNLRYFAGLRDGAWDACHFYFFLLVPAEGTPVLLVSHGFEHLVKQCWIEDVRYWPLLKGPQIEKKSNAVALVLEVLEEKGLASSTIGMELSSGMQVNLGQDDFRALTDGLPQANIVDGSEAVWRLRSIKSPVEIERLRTAAWISCTMSQSLAFTGGGG